MFKLSCMFVQGCSNYTARKCIDASVSVPVLYSAVSREVSPIQAALRRELQIDLIYSEE